jgi:hypothetical protein
MADGTRSYPELAALEAHGDPPALIGQFRAPVVADPPRGGAYAFSLVVSIRPASASKISAISVA